jgi:hypothetical protein
MNDHAWLAFIGVGGGGILKASFKKQKDRVIDMSINTSTYCSDKCIV